MSNVGFAEPCPQCKKYIAWGDMYDGDTELFCAVCGYTHEERFEFGEKALQDSWFLSHYDETRNTGRQPRKRTTVEWLGFGAFLITYRNGHQGRGCLSVPITEELIELFLQDISLPEIDPAQCYLTRWNNETNEVVFVIGREELVEDYLVENHCWDDEIGDWVGREEPLKDGSFMDLNWNEETGECETALEQEEPFPAESVTDDRLGI